jgi:GT2 family glycosyltransferase
MISVIVCSRKPESWDFHRRNIEKTIGVPYEYCRIDNTHNTYGICAAYNKGAEQAKGDILVFVHEDAFFMEPGWGAVLESKFTYDPRIGLIGVAGTQYLLPDSNLWIAAGQPFLKGRIIHELNRGETFILTVFTWDKADSDVVAIDGVFMAMSRNAFNTAKFDDINFPEFHFYDLDISMQVRKKHRIIVTWDILIKHFSGGNPNESWVKAGKTFLEKYSNELPANCTSLIPDENPEKRPGPMNFDIKGKVDQNVIV